ncbi:hypothetical protein [Clostridium paridis]|uniref:Uncharacterized protein n=1 Tax=Clostridium paridis TaxID=2803863 RepID=A0A937K296_9CLOT|nr:hypothetical protein [Clostridium paridis]MBL4931211.1 hypothetical protein [Clostridium paridis]
MTNIKMFYTFYFVVIISTIINFLFCANLIPFWVMLFVLTAMVIFRAQINVMKFDIKAEDKKMKLISFCTYSLWTITLFVAVYIYKFM